MSRETLQAIEDAILAHHRATTDTDEKPERANAVITAWVVGYEISNIVDLDEGSVIGFANSYVTSDNSPNLVAHLAHWAGGEIDAAINGRDLEDD